MHLGPERGSNRLPAVAEHPTAAAAAAPCSRAARLEEQSSEHISVGGSPGRLTARSIKRIETGRQQPTGGLRPLPLVS